MAERAGVDIGEARRATEAVLETLAARIGGGEADDLRTRLPVALHAPLERGKNLSGGKATRMKLDAFVRRVAELTTSTLPSSMAAPCSPPCERRSGSASSST